jgi:hypothetical protein
MNQSVLSGASPDNRAEKCLNPRAARLRQKVIRSAILDRSRTYRSIALDEGLGTLQAPGFRGVGVFFREGQA